LPYFDPANAESEQQHYLKVAADEVARLAPAPDPAEVDAATIADYEARAARAERLLLNYLTQTSGGVVSGKSLSGVGSRSFASEARRTVRGIVRGAMGGFYVGAGSVPIL
jgi:hypothetical protein